MNLPKLTRDQVLALARAHVVRFERLIESGRSNVRVSECKEYIRIWTSIEERAKRATNDELALDGVSEEEAAEIFDAVECGDYDEMLSSIKHGERRS